MNLLPHNLGFACCTEFHAPRWKTEFKVGGDEKGLERFLKALPEELTCYNAKDAYMGLMLSYALDTRIKETHKGQALYDGYFERSLIALGMLGIPKPHLKCTFSLVISLLPNNVEVVG